MTSNKAWGNFSLRSRIALLRGACIVILGVGLQHQVKGQSRQAITDVSIIDITGTRTLLPSMTVIIEDGKILRVAPSLSTVVPKDATIIDGKNKFLIPGLWDMHTHLSYFGKNALKLLVTNGVTGVRDMGGNFREIISWRREIAAGKMIGPRIYCAGPFIDGPKTMSPMRSSFTRVITSAEQGRQAVTSLDSMGVDFIKIHSRVPREAFFALAAEAKQKHIPIAVHAPVNLTVSEIADAGARSIEHTESLLGKAIYEDDPVARDSITNAAFTKLFGKDGQETILKLKRNGTWYDPTLISLYLLKGSAYDNKLGPRLLPVIAMLYAARIPLLTGSDFAWPDAGIAPGRDLHGELELFVKGGVSPLDALRAATINAAKCLDADDILGSVEEGKLANLVLLDGNPLENISNTRKISAVFIHGRVLMGADLVNP